MEVASFVKSKGNLMSVLMSAGTAFAGTAAAVIRGNMEILPASLCLLFAIFTQLGTNYLHAYDLHKRQLSAVRRKHIHSLDEAEPVPVENRVLKEASHACYILAAMLGVTIISMSKVPYIMGCLGILIMLIIWSIYIRGGKYMSTVWGLVCTFLLFGPIGVGGTCLMQCQYEANENLWGMYDLTPPIYVAVAMGLLAVNIHLGYSYYTHKLVPGNTARNISSKLGSGMTLILIFLNGAIACASVTYKVFYFEFANPVIEAIPFSLGFMLNSYIAIKMWKANLAELRHLTILLVVNYFLTAFALFVIWWIVGPPDDSLRTFF